jgi:hypothetical protein
LHIKGILEITFLFWAFSLSFWNFFSLVNVGFYKRKQTQHKEEQSLVGGGKGNLATILGQVAMRVSREQQWKLKDLK